MISVQEDFKIDEFKRLVAFHSEEALRVAAQEGLIGMNEETPVSTGNLKSNNKSRSDKEFAYFENDTSYAGYVHLGTYKMNANPWIIRGVTKKLEIIVRKWVEILKK